MIRPTLSRAALLFSISVTGLAVNLSAGEIHEAAERGDVEKIRLLIKAKPELVNQRDSAKNTPLHYAVLRDHAEVVEALLAAGSDGEFESGFHFGSIGSEVGDLLQYYGVQRRVKAYVEKHPDLAQGANRDAAVLLVEAVRTGVPEAVKLLLDHGLNPNMLPREVCVQAIMWNAVLQYIGLVHRDPRNVGRDEPKKVAGHLLMRYQTQRAQRLEIIKSLLAHKADVNARDSSHRAILNRVADDTLEVAALLVSAGADCNAICDDPCVPSPFQGAIEEGQVKLVQFFLEHGADPKGVTRGKLTPLHIAAFHGQETIAQIFLEHGANPNARDDGGRSPLHWSVSNAEKVGGVIKLLLKHGADVNLKNNEGETPLHCNAFSGRAVVIEFLLDHGADAKIKDNQGNTPFHAAVACANPDQVKAFLHHPNSAQEAARERKDLLEWATHQLRLKEIDSDYKKRMKKVIEILRNQDAKE